MFFIKRIHNFFKFCPLGIGFDQIFVFLQDFRLDFCKGFGGKFGFSLNNFSLDQFFLKGLDLLGQASHFGIHCVNGLLGAGHFSGKEIPALGTIVDPPIPDLVNVVQLITNGGSFFPQRSNLIPKAIPFSFSRGVPVKYNSVLLRPQAFHFRRDCLFPLFNAFHICLKFIIRHMGELFILFSAPIILPFTAFSVCHFLG